MIQHLKNLIGALLLLLALVSCADTPKATLGKEPLHPFWPVQKDGEALIICSFDNKEEHILAQSLAGLAARAVNEGRFNQLVWVDTPTGSYQQWLATIRTTRTYTSVTTMNVWELLDLLKQQMLVKGYVSYELNKTKPDNQTLNVATVLAGLSEAVLIEKTLLGKADSTGMAKLGDGADHTYLSVFEQYKDQLNRNMVLTIGQEVVNLRDMAIAHRLMTFCADAEVCKVVYPWLEPHSPVLGWNVCAGDEYNFTMLPTVYGHFNTASDWAWNIPVLSAGAKDPIMEQRMLRPFDPSTLDFSEQGQYLSFLMSDGDNVQWMLGNFCHSKRYWANPYGNDVPMGWTACIIHTSQMAPVVLDYLLDTQAPKASLVEFGGGYMYPDKFGDSLHSETTLREYARKINPYLKARGVRLFHFMCDKVDSPEARKAYQIYAEELETVDALLPIAYSGYEHGYGKIYWARNAQGIHIPVITAKYCIWQGRDRDKNAGSPVKIAADIAQAAPDAGKNAYEWVSVHAWSNFSPEELGSKVEGTGGLSAVKACVDNLPPHVKVVSLEELVWRLRMEYYPDETRKSLNSEQWIVIL